tara:strand:+ start:1541 stop:3316 length:1776 start_codon:yes stop_codon:yes gene_type:complete
MYQFINYKKVNKIHIIILFFFVLIGTANSTERSKREIKIGVFMEDFQKFGKFEKINKTPKGMFANDVKSFHQKQVISQKKFVDTFITKKGQMEKNTDQVILGMAYFEFFYMQQLKDNKKSLETFEKNYPKINAATKKNIKKIYGLNKARKSMREALGLSLENSPEESIERYYVLYKLLNQAEIKTIILTKVEKKNSELHTKISKNISQLKNITDDKLRKRLTEKKFNSEYKKNFKKLSKNLGKSILIKDYELLTSFIIEIDKYRDTNNSALLSGYKIAEYILQKIKNNKIKKKYEQDLSKAKFDIFSQNELSILGDITKSMKVNKNEKSNNIQLQIMNLENEGIPVNKFLEVYQDELNVKLDDINLQVASAAKMKDWTLSDWANAWKNPIPEIMVDDAGIEINLSPEEIESIKAQLAMKNFKELLNLDSFSNLIQNEANNFNDIAKNLEINSDNFKFSFTLDDFARSFGDSYGLDINNYSDLTDLANAQHNANWSVEEYAAAYQDNVDMINALQSGSLSSFDAGRLAAAANTGLQEVADTIRAATSAGVSVDLEATAQGLGYGSFADAVAAYNKQHGTNYSVEEAKESLGQ